MHGAKERRLPGWFKVPLSTNGKYAAVRVRLREAKLHTVCESAACPNRNECWNSGTATFLVLGDRCTRNCGFCNIPHGSPAPPDQHEPERVADTAASFGLSYAVITSVTRDDLPDGGAGVIAATIRAIRRKSPACRVEVLVPDFRGSAAALDAVLDARPAVLNHNLETVPSLYPMVRRGAVYDRSLALLGRAKARGAVTKSGLIVGLGERRDEVGSVMRDLRGGGCDILTIGQYLQPRKDRLAVQRYYHPDEFRSLMDEGLALGFREVLAAPLVRSSYRAQFITDHPRTDAS